MRAGSLKELGVRVLAWSDQAMGPQWPLRLGSALLLALFGVWIARLLSRALDRVLARFAVEQILRDFVRNIVYAVGIVVTLVAALEMLGVPTTSLLAVLGAAGLGVGLALKDSLSNIASGVMLIVQRPFHAGDVVQVAGLEGTVESVHVFQTVLRTADNRSVILPNSLITTAPIVNLTGRGQRRIEVTVGIGYGQDIGEVRAVLLEVAATTVGVAHEPAPDVLVTGLNDSSVGLVLRAWVPALEVVVVRGALYEAVHREFGRRGINIPFPQREVRVVGPGSAKLG